MVSTAITMFRKSGWPAGPPTALVCTIGEMASRRTSGGSTMSATAAERVSLRAPRLLPSASTARV